MPLKVNGMYRFGPFQINLPERVLRRRGEIVPLPPKAFDTLLALVLNAGNVMGKEQLIRAVWPDTFVEEGNLSQNVFVLRNALGETPEGTQYIQTIPKRGYRLAAESLESSSETTDPTDEPGDSRQEKTAEAPAARSIAVLPFVNLSANQESDYFADGLTEEIINVLARVPGVRVAARTSAFQFRGPGQDLRRIVELLKVRTILEGSVCIVGVRLRVTARLVDAVGGYQLWSERYERKMSDVFAVQDDIAKAIVDRLQLKLTNFAGPLVKPQTPSLPAYHAYLEGRYHYYRFTLENLERSRHFFERALRNDPQYALAYAGLADYYYSIGALGFVAPREVLPKAQEAVRKGLALDETLGEAHSSLGVLRITWEYNWTDGEQEFKRALELNPESPVGRTLYAFWFLRPLGRLDEAFAENARTLEVDPLSPFFRFFRAYLFYLEQKYELSIDQSRRVLEIDPNSFLGYRVLAIAYGKLGRFDDAIQAAERSAGLFGGKPTAIGLLGSIYAWAGRTAQAEHLIRKLKEQAAHNYVPPTTLAWIYIGLGQLDSALEWLETAVETRDPLILGLGVEPGTKEYASDPRFRRLLRHIGLPEIPPGPVFHPPKYRTVF